MLNKSTVDAIKSGIANLEAANVTPMGLAIYQNSWQLFKFKALPGHPKPKNAGYGYSHPTNMDVFKTSKGDAEININSITSPEKAQEVAHQIGDQLGFATAEIGQATSTGEVLQIVLLRGGAQDFLTNDIQLGSQESVSAKEREHLKVEESATDSFVSTWGGKREGSGRPQSDRKRRSINLTDAEYLAVSDFVNELRGEKCKLSTLTDKIAELESQGWVYSPSYRIHVKGNSFAQVIALVKPDEDNFGESYRVIKNGKLGREKHVVFKILP